MDSTTGGVLGILGFLISGGGAIYAAINHKKIRFKCCGKDIDMSVDIDETKPKVKPKPKKKSSKGESESKKDEETPPEQSPEQSPEESPDDTEEEVVVVAQKKPIKKIVPVPPIRGQRSSKVANYDS